MQALAWITAAFRTTPLPRREQGCQEECTVVSTPAAFSADVMQRCLPTAGADGAFDGRRKALLEALERQLYDLDKIRAAAGEKLSPKVQCGFRVVLSLYYIVTHLTPRSVRASSLVVPQSLCS
jgi:hypothetical protein